MSSSDNKVDSTKQYLNVANFLQSPKDSNLRVRHGVLNGKRVRFFKGKSAINSLISDTYSSKNLPGVSSREDGEQILKELLSRQLILCAQKVDTGKPSPVVLKVNSTQDASENDYYIWLYEPTPWSTILGGIGIVAAVLAFVMYPLWPPMMQKLVWYASLCGIGFLGFIFVLGIIRLILFVISFIFVPPGFWLFPNLFADCGFFESFVPLYEWHVSEPPKSKGKKAQ